MWHAAMDAGDQAHSIVQVVLYSALHVPQVYSEPYSYMYSLPKSIRRKPGIVQFWVGNPPGLHGRFRFWRSGVMPIGMRVMTPAYQSGHSKSLKYFRIALSIFQELRAKFQPTMLFASTYHTGMDDHPESSTWGWNVPVLSAFLTD